ncbi:MAG: TetR/AcrR family transcriptional regulator [Flavobacteriaceae bacterium]
MKDSNTEQDILNAAITIFQRKGMAGARMQEIADEANINKAMLHYYFRNKQQLFEAVFMQAFQKFAPQMNGIFNSNASVFDKINGFAESYISFVTENPYLPTFLIQEINVNPDFTTTFFTAHSAPDPTMFENQIAEEIKKGILKPVDPKQLLLNLFSLCAFPFVGSGLVRGVLKLDKNSFNVMMEERKKLIPELIIKSIRA